MSKSVTFVRHHAKPGKRDEIKRIWDKYVRDYVAADGATLAYYYSYDDKDPDAVVAIQLSANQTSGQDFVKQPWFGDYQRETAALMAAPSEILTATPQWVKGA
jgi:quinol monooxygenase YgiN